MIAKTLVISGGKTLRDHGNAFGKAEAARRRAVYEGTEAAAGACEGLVGGDDGLAGGIFVGGLGGDLFG
jgi:hypothetical protein